MSRIYIVTDRTTGKVARYVRAHTLNSAVRAAAAEKYTAEAASTESMFQAMKSGTMDVLDALEPVQVDVEDKA